MMIYCLTFLCKFKEETNCIACHKTITTEEKAILLDVQETMLYPPIMFLCFHKNCYDEKMVSGIEKFVEGIYVEENYPMIDKKCNIIITQIN